MADLSATSQVWWDGRLAAAGELYETSGSEPRLRLRPVEHTDPVHQRVEQRGVALLLSILPDQL